MSREDRRLAPGDSVNTYMHPVFMSPYSLPHHMSDPFAYYPSLPDPSLRAHTVYPPSNLVQEVPYFSMPLEMQRPAPPAYLPAQPYPSQFLPAQTFAHHEPFYRSFSTVDPHPRFFGSPQANYTGMFTPAGEYPATYLDASYEYLSQPPAAEYGGHSPFLPSHLPHHPNGAPAKPRRKPAPQFPPAPRASGFIPSDPDRISAHEKKRNYVACLEGYVKYLHDLFASMEVEPLPFERMTSYRGLNSRSMRTILIYLGKEADKAHDLVTQEDNKVRRAMVLLALILNAMATVSETSATQLYELEYAEYRTRTSADSDCTEGSSSGGSQSAAESFRVQVAVSHDIPDGVSSGGSSSASEPYSPFEFQAVAQSPYIEDDDDGSLFGDSSNTSPSPPIYCSSETELQRFLACPMYSY
ncbi:hypothetical protein C8J57DRAFT_1491025 [Mycena rebaudengoi]|nr:hypothetical protein C8J57DRAFT_1491025 [Mycena rebaudengoi]